MSVRPAGQRSRYIALGVVAVACLVLLSYTLSTASTMTAPSLAVADAVSRLTSEPGGLFVRAGPELWLQPAAGSRKARASLKPVRMSAALG